MKSTTHTKRMGQPLHIEAPGCIINIYAGLETNGQPVTVIQVHCDGYGLGDTWRLEDGKNFASLRVIKQETKDPAGED